MGIAGSIVRVSGYLRMVSKEDEYYKSTSFDMRGYLEGRPPYTGRLYDYMYQHHKGDWANALDIATGPGMVARELAGKFDNVIGVDFNEKYVETARELSQGYANLTFQQAYAEDLSQFPDKHFDLVVIGQAAQWFKNEAFEEIGRVLKPQGSLVMWFYANGYVPGDPAATKVLHDMFFKFNQIFPYTKDTDEMFQRITSGLDHCRLPQRYFEPGTRRLRFNYKDGLCVNPPGVYPCRVSLPSSEIPETDEFVHIEDPDILTVTKAWDWYKRYMSVLIPMEHLDLSEVYRDEFEQLDKILGGKTVKYSWALSMVLARKKK